MKPWIQAHPNPISGSIDVILRTDGNCASPIVALRLSPEDAQQALQALAQALSDYSGRPVSVNLSPLPPVLRAPIDL